MRYMKVKIFAGSVLILIAAIALISMPRASAQMAQSLSAEDQKLLDVAAKQEGLNTSQLQLLKSTTVELPLTGRKVQTAKVLNADNGQSFTASIDEQGQSVDFSILKDEEQNAYRAKYGKLHPKLHQKIEDLGSEQSSKDPGAQEI